MDADELADILIALGPNEYHTGDKIYEILMEIDEEESFTFLFEYLDNAGYSLTYDIDRDCFNVE